MLHMYVCGVVKFIVVAFGYDYALDTGNSSAREHSTIEGILYTVPSAGWFSVSVSSSKPLDK